MLSRQMGGAPLGPSRRTAGGLGPGATGLRGDSGTEEKVAEGLRSRNEKPPRDRRGPRAVPEHPVPRSCSSRGGQGHSRSHLAQWGPQSHAPRPSSPSATPGGPVTPACLSGSLSLPPRRSVARPAGQPGTQTLSPVTPGQEGWNQGGVWPGGHGMGSGRPGLCLRKRLVDRCLSDPRRLREPHIWPGTRRAPCFPRDSWRLACPLGS